MITHSSDSLTGNILCARSELAGGDRGKQDTDSPLPRGRCRGSQRTSFQGNPGREGALGGAHLLGAEAGGSVVPEAGATRHVSQVSARGGTDHPTNGTRNDSRGLVSHLLAPSLFFPFYIFSCLFLFISS